MAAAFRAADHDGDSHLSYSEFEHQMQEWAPGISTAVAQNMCRFLDTNGDGCIDLSEFSKVMMASDDNLRVSRSALAKKLEVRQWQVDKGGGRGRFASTPAAAYGVQLREIMTMHPQSNFYMSDAQRLSSSVAQQERPDFQVADTAFRKARQQAKDLRREYYKDRQAAMLHARDADFAARAQQKMESKYDQRFRYMTSVAWHERSRLRT